MGNQIANTNDYNQPETVKVDESPAYASIKETAYIGENLKENNIKFISDKILQNKPKTQLQLLCANINSAKTVTNSKGHLQTPQNAKVDKKTKKNKVYCNDGPTRTLDGDYCQAQKYKAYLEKKKLCTKEQIIHDQTFDMKSNSIYHRLNVENCIQIFNEKKEKEIENELKIQNAKKPEDQNSRGFTGSTKIQVPKFAKKEELNTQNNVNTGFNGTN